MATTERAVTPAKNGTKSHAAQRPAFPAVRNLATPTNLSPEAVQAVTEALNHLVADSFALYVKTKNFHWHLAGSHFRDYHLLFDEQAEQILESIDPQAERARRIGGTTIRSIAHIRELQSIKDDDEAFVPAEEMVKRLLADNRQVAVKQRQAMELAEEKGDHPTANLLQELLDLTERRIWFLFEISQGGSNAE